MRLWELLLPDDLYILPHKIPKVNTFFELFLLFFAQFLRENRIGFWSFCEVSPHEKEDGKKNSVFGGIG